MRPVLDQIPAILTTNIHPNMNVFTKSFPTQLPSTSQADPDLWNWDLLDFEQKYRMRPVLDRIHAILTAKIHRKMNVFT